MSKISKHAIVEEGALIGQNVVIEAWAYIDSKSVIGDGTKVMHHSVIKNSQLGNDNMVGQFVLLRDVTTDSEVRIGPHSEVARTHFHNKSMASHKATIIDAEIMSFVKIGPNFITANLDFIKEKKFKTLIKQGALIGGNVTLLAPITIGAGSRVGANSFINKDVKGGHTVFNKKDRVEYPNKA